MKSTRIAFFDFDHTITTKDTLFEFIFYVHGKVKGYLGLLLLSPMLIMYKIGLLPNWYAKKIVLKLFFKGFSESELRELGNTFGHEIIPKILRPEAVAAIERHKESGDKVVVVSASCDVWLSSYCASNSLELIATELKFQNSQFIGSWNTLNCSGEEKVRRINEKIDLSQYNSIYVYGDSKADKPMLALADFPFYRTF